MRVAMLLFVCAASCADDAPAAPACEAPASQMGRVPYHECATAGVCPARRVPNDATRPTWRMTYLRPTSPSAIANAAVEDAVDTRIQNGTFLWALGVDFAAMTFRTGSFNPDARTPGAVGLGLLDARYAYFHGDATGAGDAARYDPVEGTVTLSGDRWSTSTVVGPVRLPIYNPDGSLFTVLPLTNLRLHDVLRTADRGCIGAGRPQNGRFAEGTSVWNTVDDAGTPYGVVEADISAADARGVSVLLDDAVVPLCDVLAGAPCSASPETWPKRPDTAVGAEPAWHLQAYFAAVSAALRP